MSALEVPPNEFRLPFFEEKDFVRRLCEGCGLHYWTQNPDAEHCGDAPCIDYTFIGNPPTKKKLEIGEMRELFLSFFEERGHKRISPYPVVARWRDDLMVTIASIIDFQPYVTEGIIPPPANPLVVSQPCIRFEDIDLVGHTAGRHLTFFEMGGHHAFNYRDKPQIYWKDETVRLHHELLTKNLGVPSEMITYKEGLWSGGGNAGFDLEGCVGGLEISTLVFMMYRVVGERFEPMPIQVVDTGYGIERWSWLSQGAPSAFHAVYGSLLDTALSWAGLTVDESLLSEAAKYSCLVTLENKERERRRLAGILDMDPLELEKLLSPVEAVYAALDHTKGMAFILSEGVVPSNVREGYLARLLFRRSFRLLRRIEMEHKLPDLVEAQIAQWGSDFHQLREMRDEIMEMVAVEDEKYRDTLRRGKSLVGRYLKLNKDVIPVEKIVEFYDSHGLTPEDVKEAAAEAAIQINVPDNFYSLVAQRHMKPVTQKEEAEEKGLTGKVEGLEKTSLLFYRDPYLREFNAEVIAVIDDRYIVLDRTAFYAEGGGQISDIGKLMGPTQLNVVDVQSVEDVLLHDTEKANTFRKGDKVRGIIDWERRVALMRSHTATHLLLGAAKRVLGDHAWQAGAQKGVEHSRLDISHYNRLTRDEIEAIELLANQVVTEGRDVACRWMQRDAAEARYGFRLYQGGAVPGKEIRIVEVEGGWDAEACGGTHLNNTSETGLIKIINVERVQDGVERLVFATGPKAIKEIQKRDRILMELSEVLESPQEKVRETASNIIDDMKKLRHERDDYLRIASYKISQDLLSRAHHLNGLKLVVISEDKNPDFLIEVGNIMVELETKTVALMRSTLESRFIVKTGKDAIAQGIHAGKLAEKIAKNIGGGGGGEPHFGQGGGFEEKKADSYFSKMNMEKIKKIVEEMLKHPQ